jgi:hypothetical protein
MEYNLKITFGGKSYFAEMDGNSDQIFTKEKLVESSEFSDWTDDEESESYGASSFEDKQWWTTSLGDLFKEAVSLRIEYLQIEI